MRTLVFRFLATAVAAFALTLGHTTPAYAQAAAIGSAPLARVGVVVRDVKASVQKYVDVFQLPAAPAITTVKIDLPKGSIKVKDCLLRVDSENSATITTLTFIDKIRLRNQKLGITRVMFRPNSDIHKALQKNEFKHSPFKNILGRCATGFVICDILDKREMMIASLKYTKDIRIVKPNESYYQEYDNIKEDTIPVDYGHPSTPFEYS